MASFQKPFQCLKYFKRQPAGLCDLLITSAGSYLYSFAEADGQRLDVWPQDVDPSSDSVSGAALTADSEAPPEKKRRISPAAENQNGCSDKVPAWSSIPFIVTSSDGKYVVVMTAEDKSIRVLTLSPEGKFRELSCRAMPKRLSAVCLTPDSQNILCADKSGDVYSLPLIPGEYVKTQVEAKSKLPAATPLTVHTKRNLETLRQQKLAAEKSKPEDSTALNFEHQLILGHVSILTDIVSVSLSGRNHILTADRDEHIRVSRGIPQAHIIEQYCLGHTSFISKLCVPTWAPEILVSGGGDSHLFLWNWVEGQVLQKVPLPESLPTTDPIVRGIWDVSLDSVRAILVSLNGLSHLLCYTIDNNSLKLQDTIEFSGNVLDMAVIDSRGTIVVSVDNMREPGSTDTWKSSPGDFLEALRITSSPSGLKCNLTDDLLVTNINSAYTSDLPINPVAEEKKAIDEALYSLGSLRKKTFDD